MSPTAGPTTRGSIEVGDAWLGHRRLSIVDLEGGQQPLEHPDGGSWLVGNGEIYNHERRARAARRPGGADRLRQRGRAARCSTRTGPTALARAQRHVRVRGRRADDGRFVAARDPVGIKPLYWAQRDGAVRFASEMHAFDPDWQPVRRAVPARLRVDAGAAGSCASPARCPAGLLEPADRREDARGTRDAADRLRGAPA